MNISEFDCILKNFSKSHYYRQISKKRIGLMIHSKNKSNISINFFRLFILLVFNTIRLANYLKIPRKFMELSYHNLKNTTS